MYIDIKIFLIKVFNFFISSSSSSSDDESADCFPGEFIEIIPNKNSQQRAKQIAVFVICLWGQRYT